MAPKHSGLSQCVQLSWPLTALHSLPSSCEQLGALLPPTVCFLSLSVRAPGKHDSLLSTASVPSKRPLCLDGTFPAWCPGPSSNCSEHAYNLHVAVHLCVTDPSLETERDAWR